MNDDRRLLVIDADAPLQSLLDMLEPASLLYSTLTETVSWQIRNETSIGRALRAPRIALRWAAALLALGAKVVVESDAGTAEVPVEAWLRREAEGNASQLRVTEAGVRWGEARVGRTPCDDPIVAAVAALRVADGIVQAARVALIGVWPESVRLVQAPSRLIGGPLDQERIQAVAEAVEEEVDPPRDFRGSEEYRRAMASVLTRRALEKCAG
jgi:carbon-monoxide dehydrogenase medium subunit